MLGVTSRRTSIKGLFESLATNEFSFELGTSAACSAGLEHALANNTNSKAKSVIEKCRMFFSCQARN
jgi:hypothetical protein